jgi:RNA polymerase sigma factor (TIGR02999 family)
MAADITGLLERWGRGDREAFDALLPLVYKELRRLARHHLGGERSGHTLQPTALVHEAYLRLRGERDIHLEHRAHFFGAAANVMRRILVDHARRHRAQKRGGGVAKVADIDECVDAAVDVHLDLAALDEALVDLEKIAPEKARVVELRYFGGLSVEEAAEHLNLSPATVKRYWAFSRAWLYRRLSGSDSLPPAAGA